MLLVNVGQGKSLHCPQLCSPRPMEHKVIRCKSFLRGGKLFNQLLPELCIPCFRINKKRTIAAVETAAG